MSVRKGVPFEHPLKGEGVLVEWTERERFNRKEIYDLFMQVAEKIRSEGNSHENDGKSK
jgi:hypothetical protein